jgi:integrative and conjugative element protein (TIGR02256 family)
MNNIGTSGQTEALRQLSQIVKASRGGIGVAKNPHLDEVYGGLHVELWINANDASSKATETSLLGSREPVMLHIPSDFPFRYPDASFPHVRFASLPHVQWGSYLCLYASPNDWEPSDGMWGFIERLLTWFLRAEYGKLADPALPWHPPVAYVSNFSGTLTMRADIPDHYESNDSAWSAWAAIAEMELGRLELIGWVSAATTGGPDYEELIRYRSGSSGSGSNQVFAAPMIALTEPLSFEYPENVDGLIRSTAQQGIGVGVLERLLENALRTNERVRSSFQYEPPLILLLGSPAPGRASSPSRVSYVAAWRVSDVRNNEIPALAELAWMRVYDQRPRSTVRRDTGRPSQWLRDQRVLILGCGALGAPTAEHLVRASVRSLTIVDNGRVNPGILVRQPYMYSDIGTNKAKALGKRLRNIDPRVTIIDRASNALDIFNEKTSFDLIIDATANRSVAAKIEHLWWTTEENLPPILSLMVGHASQHGLATLALPGSTGAGTDILRRFAIAASKDLALADVLNDFFPDPPRTEAFRPEPGCSDPTFVGSSADLSLLATGMLNSALVMLNDTPKDDRGKYRPARTASLVRLPDGLQPHAAGVRMQWANDFICDCQPPSYEIRIQKSAFTSMRREALRASAVCDQNETGGVLLGQVDHGCHVVWVNDVYGIPPDSRAAPDRLEISVRNIRGQLAQRRHESRGMVSFIGVWHSHPASRVQASARDRETMDDLVNGPHETLSQALLIIVGGTDGRWQRWLEGETRPDMYAELFFASHK